MSQALADKMEIRRKDNIPDEVRTPDRDKAAKVIDEMWPAHLNEIADESGYSRQHIRNVLSHYYQTEERDEPQRERKENGLTIQVPDNVDKSSYLRGVVDGMDKAH